MKKKLFLLFIFILVIVLKIDNGFALTINDIGDSNIGTFSKCSEGKWNGCLYRSGYRYSIVKYNSNTYTVTKLENYKTYEDYGIKPGVSGVSNYNWNSSNEYKGLRDRIIEGGELFNTILRETGIDKNTFFNNNFYILIEPYFLAYYDSNGANPSKACPGSVGCYENTRYVGGFPKDIAKYVKDNSNVLNGFVSINQLLPCTLYIGYNGTNSNQIKNDSYCKEVAIGDHWDEYLDLVINNTRYGKALISAKEIDITDYCDDTTPKISISRGCTSTTIENKNIGSCTTVAPEKYDINGQTVYCTTNFNLNTSDLNRYSDSNKFVKSGTIIFKDLTNIAKVELKKMCFSGAELSVDQVFGNFQNEYFNYIKSIELLDQKLTPVQDSYSQVKTSNKSGTYNQYIATHTYFYTKTTYLENLTGEEILENDLENFSAYIKQQGLVTKFTYKSGEQYFLPKVVFGEGYTVNYKNYIDFNSFDNVDEEDKCLINFEEELIQDIPDNPNGSKFNLEFRTITTSNSFPGKNGSTREVGSNWCELNEDGTVKSCSGDDEENTLIKSVMSRNDSYNKTGDGPKYKITLTPLTIKEIRKYNSEIPYDDVNLKCEENICISNYLTSLKNKGVLIINNSEKRSKINE